MGKREERKESSAHARPTSRSVVDRVNAKLRVGPDATAPPINSVAASGQKLHLAF